MTKQTTPTPSDPLPIACSLEPASGQARVARWRALADRALETSARTNGGAWQRYRLDPEVEAELVELVALEGQCCEFLAFELTHVDDALELEVRGPVDADPILDAFAQAS